MSPDFSLALCHDCSWEIRAGNSAILKARASLHSSLKHHDVVVKDFYIFSGDRETDSGDVARHLGKEEK